MRNLSLLRLLLASLLLYIAWPHIPTATSTIGFLFWAIWLGFFLLVFGANLASLLRMIQAPIMEQSQTEKKVRAKR